MLGIDIQQILLHLLNFTILFAGLYILLYSPVKSFMDKRRKEYADADTEAEKKKELVANSEAEIEKLKREAEKEISEMKQKANADISRMRQESEDEARVKAEKILSNAKREAEIEKSEILDSAKGEIAKLVEEAAEKMILSADTDAVFDSFLDNAERSLEENGTEDA